MRREGPIALGMICGFLVILSKFLDVKFLTDLRTGLDNWSTIALSFATFLGIVSLSMLHLRKISQNKPDKIYSYVILACMWGYLGYGMTLKTVSAPKFAWIYRTAMVPMGATVFALLAFYIASAAYRSFRVRSAEATVLLIAAIFTMLGNVTIGKLIWSEIPGIRQWILAWPNTAGMRGIQIGAALGGISTALRVLLGIERAHLGQ